MDRSRIDVRAVAPALDAVAVLAMGAGVGLLPVARGAAEALFAIPADQSDDREPAAGDWVAVRGDHDGSTEISAWRDPGANAPVDAAPQVGLHATWDAGTFVGVSVASPGRIWSTLAEGAGSIGGDMAGDGGAGATVAGRIDDLAAEARRIREAWDRDNHAPRGWACPACGWESEPDTSECAACRRPRGPAAVSAGPQEDPDALGYAADEPPAVLAAVAGLAVPVGRADVDPEGLLDGLLEAVAGSVLVAGQRAITTFGQADDRAAPEGLATPPVVGARGRTCVGCGLGGLPDDASFCARCGHPL